MPLRLPPWPSATGIDMSVRMKLLGVQIVAIVAACGSEATEYTSETIHVGTGELALALQVDSGLSIDAVLYEIRGNGESLMGGLPLGGSGIHFSAAIPDIPVGLHYDLRLSATTADPNVACVGTASFDITSRTTTVVNLKLSCDELDASASTPDIHLQTGDSGCATRDPVADPCAANTASGAAADAGLPSAAGDARVAIDAAHSADVADGAPRTDAGQTVDATPRDDTWHPVATVQPLDAADAVDPQPAANATASTAADAAVGDDAGNTADGAVVDAGMGEPSTSATSDPPRHPHRGRTTR